MKKSLTDYISALTGTSTEMFEDLIGNKFRKFLKFFEIVKDYSEYIKKLDYEVSDKDALIVKIEFTKDVSLDDKKDLISEMKESGYSIEKSKLKSKHLELKIIYKE